MTAHPSEYGTLMPRNTREPETARALDIDSILLTRNAGLPFLASRLHRTRREGAKVRAVAQRVDQDIAVGVADEPLGAARTAMRGEGITVATLGQGGREPK
jgi:hypothetical protein